MKSVTAISLGLGLLAVFGVCGALKLSRVLVPSYKFYGESAVLECPYELGTNQRDRLYAVKWYFNGDEFYRYVPKYTPPILTHNIRGVHVKISGSDSKQVTLQNLDLHSTGIYRCEVSCEAPDFSSVHGDGTMTVIHLPEKGPQINGNVKEDYTPGDILDINCTTSESFPPARLTWYLNDLPVPKEFVIEPINPKQGISAPQLTSSVSTLRLPLDDDHFTEDGDTKILCKANISPMFWQDGDERTVGSARKPESRSTTFNVAPITLSDQDAFLYLRGSSSATNGSIITLTLILMARWTLATICTRIR